LNLSIGKVGNEAPLYLTNTAFESYIVGGDRFITGIEFPAFGHSSIEAVDLGGNRYLKGEKSTALEIGTQLELFKGRIGLHLTYFDEISDDLIVISKIPSSSGFSEIATNSGKVSNKGWEVDVSIQPLRFKKFIWDVGLNFYANKNKVEYFPENAVEKKLEGFTSTLSRMIEGEAYGAIVGDGFLKNDEGQPFIDEQGWPMRDPNKQWLGNPNPDWIMGIHNSFEIFNRIRISALLDIRKGGDMWSGTMGVMNYFGVTKQSAEERNDVVVFEGIHEDGSPNTTAVALANPGEGLGSYYRVRNGFGYSAMNIFDTSWIRLRELAVSYSLSPKLLEKLPLSGLTVTLSGHNVWLKTNYPGIDPETNLTGTSNGFGLDYFNMPNTKSYTASLKMTF
ncbi:MAG: TonB-dependent receptor, partial [Bacteroidetes bacterium]|nr:TonB-dependent receptor [Bacteroidota bacterium]